MSGKERVSEDPKVQNIIEEIDEDIQRERLKKIWEKYGNHFIALALAIVLGTGATVSFKSWQHTRNAENTARFIAAIDAAQGKDTAAATSALEGFAKDAPEIQAALADLQVAALKAKGGDKAGAVAIYDRLASCNLPAPYRNLATILSVDVQADDGDADALLAKLAPLMDANSPWRTTARELGAVINLRKGSTDEARRLLQENLDDSDAPADVRGRDQTILQNME